MPESFIQINIFLPYIESAHIGHLIVNDYDLAVITVVDTQLESSQDRREKLRRLHALFIQLSPKAVPHGTTTHGIEQHSHFHTLRRFFDQNILDLIE